MKIISNILKTLELLNKIKIFYFLNPSYSQEGEDILLKRIFEKKKITKGFYVDIGCFHPIKYSNTYLLFLKGWKGINIDANPLSIKYFAKKRPNDTNINIGISSDERVMSYYSFNIPALNTFSKEQADLYLQNKINKLLGVEQVEVKPLQNILKHYLPVEVKITLMSIDVEGIDYDVLLSNDWDKYLPSVIVIENHSSKIEMLNSDKIYLFLNSKGYYLHSKLDLSCIYIHNTF